MFVSLFSLCFYAYIYSKGLIDLKAFNFNSFKIHTLWVGFSISWVLIILLILYFIPRNKRIGSFIVISILSNILFFAQICYVQSLGKFMIFSDLFVAGEGLQYIKSIFLNLNLGMIVTMIFSLLCTFFVYLLNKNVAKSVGHNDVNYVIVVTTIIVIVLCRMGSYFSLGSEAESNSWQESYNPKSIYVNYTSPNVAMFISGFYEYNFRIVYKYIYNTLTLDKAALRNNIDEYNAIYGVKTKDNEYTGLFDEKNVIVVMMESIDSWIIDEDTMPTVKHMMDTGLNFTNRYSPFFNGGQTINSEFAINTGLYAISEKDTIYDLDDVDYTYSLANMLKNKGYTVNSFHANTGNFYNRTEFHKRLGYDKHYSMLDLQRAGKLSEKKNYFSDLTMFSDDDVFDMMTSEDKFLAFITTYSAHLEYIKDNKVYKDLKEHVKGKYSEEEYIYRSLAHDTDNALKVLINKLKSSNKLDDTVIVLVSDHYVYGYSDPEYVALKKNTLNDRNQLQNTPFIIWNSELEHKSVDTIMDTADILPTLLNLMGITYDATKYIGTDVFSEYHDHFVFFADGTYIAGKDSVLSNEAILTKTNYMIRKNKNILLTNYYGK